MYIYNTYDNVKNVVSMTHNAFMQYFITYVINDDKVTPNYKIQNLKKAKQQVIKYSIESNKSVSR